MGNIPIPGVKLPPFAVPLITTVSPTLGAEGDTDAVIDGLFRSVVALVAADTGIISSNPTSIRIQNKNNRFEIFITDM